MPSRLIIEPGTLAIGISHDAQRGTMVVPLNDPKSSHGYTFDGLIWLRKPTPGEQMDHLASLSTRGQQTHLLQ